MSKVKNVHNLIVLDESGSMGVVKAAVLNGFRQLQRDIELSAAEHKRQKHFISLSTFNGRGIKHRLLRQPVVEMARLGGRNYEPDSTTPLYDAICQSVLRLRNALADSFKYRALVTVITDGLENASKRFSLFDTNKLVGELSEDSRWGFGLIGAGFDVMEVAEDLAIPQHRTIQFESTEHDVNRMFKRYGAAQRNMANEFAKGGAFDQFDDIPF